MSAWSQSEAARTIEEVKRRSLIDPEFRALALAHPQAALAKVNPRPIPQGSVRFVESRDAAQAVSDSRLIVAVLPDLNSFEGELSEDDLENVAGGGNTNPPVGSS